MKQKCADHQRNGQGRYFISSFLSVQTPNYLVHIYGKYGMMYDMRTNKVLSINIKLNMMTVITVKKQYLLYNAIM